MNQSKFEIYQLENGETEINVQLKDDSVWLNLSQLVTLFKRDKSVISRHINNIFKEGELIKESVVAKNATTASDGKQYQVEYYNLDLIISVGYRVKSKQGIKFRIWANQILKSYIVKGYVLNQERLLRKVEQLNELQKSIKILKEVFDYNQLNTDQSRGLIKIISDYSYGLELLDKYDYQSIEITDTSEFELEKLTYDEAIKQVLLAKQALGNSELFGREKDDSFRSSIATIYQTCNGTELYPSVEEKASNLLYCQKPFIYRWK